MTGFVLEYGAETGEAHVSIDMSKDSVTVWYGNDKPVQMNTDEFSKRYPELLAEMVRNRVLRLK